MVSLKGPAPFDRLAQSESNEVKSDALLSPQRIRMTTRWTAVIAACFLIGISSAPRAQSDQPIALVGGTLVDGSGGAPVPNATVVIDGGRIAAAGPQSSTPTPAGARVVDTKGRFIVPGFIDTNVHLSLYGGVNERYETLVRYHDRQDDIVLEAAQLQLKWGVTTVRDSYGVLPPLVRVRDRIARGEAVGSRMLVAGNIVGWGGPYSVSFSLIRENALTLFQERMNDEVTQDAGESLMDLAPAELRKAIDAYLDKGPDFIKYGGTSHFGQPTFIGFSPEAQQVIVEAAHARQRLAETHATSPEGLRLAVAAGIDLIQHPEVLSPRELPDDLVKTVVERKVICSMLVNTITGEAWQKHEKTRTEAEKKIADEEKKTGQGARTSGERRKRAADLETDLETRRKNAQALIRAGAVVTLGTDNYWAAAPEFARSPKAVAQDHGVGTIVAIEGLVELGMTPAQAIVAGTRNGAAAGGAAADYGVIAAGKSADLVVLERDPLADIKNIRAIQLLMKGGKIIDREQLPSKRVLSRAPQATESR